MKHLKRLLPTALIASCAGLPLSAAAAAPQDWNQWVRQLSSQGYAVSQGTAYTMTSCDPFVAVFGNCAGNNPVTPYVILQPPMAGEYYDKAYGASNPQDPASTGVNQFFRLGDDEALVTVVTLPPLGAYFGYQTYDFSRHTSHYPERQRQTGLIQAHDAGDTRLGVFASVGNDVNNAVIGQQTAQNPGAWSAGTTVVYITTSNQVLADQLKASAATAGDVAQVLVEPLGLNIDTGLDMDADDFFTLIRYAVPADQDAGNAWLADASRNVSVYRVGAASIPVTRFPDPAYSHKAMTAESLQDEFALRELSQLLNGWLATRQGSANTVPFLASDLQMPNGNLKGLVGSACLDNGYRCFGDNQDTDAYRAALVGNLTAGQAVFVAGVDHTALGNARYIGLSIYDMSSFKGVAGIAQTDQASTGFMSGTLRGSASTVLQALGLYDQASSQLKAHLAELYVAMIARPCADGSASCATAGLSGDWITTVDTNEVAYGHPIAVLHRAYLKPGTTTGPAPDLMVTPRLIHTSTFK